MPDAPSSPKAVFLSYASQDVAAALRICAALRAAEVEVWLDQEGGLVGGDAWDRKIREQIASCALFVPIISANTQARKEGYFRLEWKLAEDRSHLMAKGVPFIVPVSIDATGERGALVPDAFTAVQWTRLPEGAATPQFVERVKKLLAPDDSRVGARLVHTQEDKRGQAAPRPPGRSRFAVAAGLAVLLLVVAGVALTRKDDPAARRSASQTTDNAARSSPSSPPAEVAKSVAVLAFTNLSDDKGADYFSDGISEELLNVLAKVPGLKVTARTSSFFFKGKDTPIPEIARQLGVAYVVEGSVRKAGTQLRISARLLNAADSKTVWADDFREELKDVFALQDKIAGLIAQNLRLTLGTAMRKARTVDPEAYRLLLEGRYFFNRRDPESFTRAEAAFTAALKIDRELAEAQAGLAGVYVIRANFSGMEGLPGFDDIAPDLRRARRAAQGAIELDPTQADAHSALGFALMLENRLA